jgi:tetratricopeptide (TPR) repeat protein
VILRRFEEAEGPLIESVAILEKVADEYELARSRFSLARVYEALGKRAASLEMLDRCLEVFERLDAAMDLAAVHQLCERCAAPRVLHCDDPS